MANCKLDYIENQSFSDTEKQRLVSIHKSIFDRAKASKAFRNFNDKLFTLKNNYPSATQFVYNTNNEYNAPITRIDTSAPGQHYLNVNVLPLAEEIQGELFQVENIPVSVASKETLDRVKEALVKMKVSLQDLSEYAKKDKLDTKTINGLADLSRGIIAIADGKESVALTEEMVHIATQIIEQTNPKMITEMISKIDRFNIYKKVYQEYKDIYTLPNGKPDIRKIKKEAVDKLIAELIVNNGQEFEQYPELREETNRSLVRKWWTSILDFIKGLYRESNIYIFDEAAKQIIEGEIGTVEEMVGEGVLFQLSDKQKEIQERIKLTSERVEKVQSNEKVDPILLDSEEANNFYRIKDDQGNWTKITRRVTDRVKNWYKERFPGKVFSKSEQEFNELKRQYGVQGHQDLEEIHSRFYNTDGTKRENPLEKPKKFNLPSQDMYDKLEKWYTGYIKSLPKDTLVFSEVIIYDEKQKEAGTIDFLAVEPSGKTHILDWKFMNVSADQEDVAWYKQGAYNLQIGRYKDILRDNYGVKEFGQLRAIPIIMKFEFKKDKSPQIKGIAIGSLDTSKIQDLTLLPVAEESESTGYEALDNIIGKLNAHLKQVAKEKVTSEEEREFKYERMSIISKAVRLAHITQNVVPLIDVIEVMRKEGDRILGEYTTTYKDRPASSEDNTDSELSDFSEEMNDYISLSRGFEEISDDLGDLIYSEGLKEEGLTEKEITLRKGFLDKLNTESTQLRKLRKKIQESSEAFADKHIGERNLVVSLLKPEKIVKGLGSTFRGVSEFGLKAVDILVKLARSAQNKASESALKEIQELISIREKLSKRGNIKELAKRVYEKDEKGNIVNRIIRQYQVKFFEEVDKKAKEGGDLKWLKDNINIEEYKKEAQEKINNRIKQIKQTPYPGSDSEVADRVEEEILKTKRLYDITRPDFIGWNNYIIKRHPLEKWESEEYKSIKNDSDLMDLYKFIVKYNNKAKDIGYIANNISSKTFLPFVRKSMAESLSWDFGLSVINNFNESLKLTAGDTGYGSVNEITGELENSIPKYYTYDFTKKDGVNDYSEVSDELFKNLILYIQQVEKYKYMTEIEGQLKLVKTVEEFKGHLNTDRSGNVIRDSAGNVEIQGKGVHGGNSENTKMFDDFMRVLVYDQKYVLTDTDTPLNFGKITEFVKKSINKITGKEVFKPEENPTPTSLFKSMDAMNRAFQLKTLGFDIVSGAVNLFGSNIQIATQAGNYFKAREFAKNEAKLIAQKFKNEEEKEIFIQLINTFMPLKEDPAYKLYKEAGMTVLTRQNLGDILMTFMREGELLVEKAAFLSLLDNGMIIDGKIVNIREYVKSKYRGQRINSSDFRRINPLIEKEVEELKNTQSISKTRKLIDGKLVIPGLDLTNRQELQRLTNLSRNIASKATGSLTKENLNRMSMSIWTKSMMVFKNWIAPLAFTRFDEFRKVADDFTVVVGEDGTTTGEKYDIGRLRLLGYVLTFNIFKGTQNLINIMKLTEKGIQELDIMFEDFKAKYELQTGEKLNITREDFIDLIRTNLRNQLKELAILAGLMGTMLSLGFIAPDDDEDKAAKNAHRYALKVVDKFVSELSFFYNPDELRSILTGGIFPALGLVNDFERFMHNFWLEITGLDYNSETSYDEVRKKAQPIKYAMRMFPISKQLVTYLSIMSDSFAKDFDVTIPKESNR